MRAMMFAWLPIDPTQSFGTHSRHPRRWGIHRLAGELTGERKLFGDANKPLAHPAARKLHVSYTGKLGRYSCYGGPHEPWHGAMHLDQRLEH
jgi:hypothetical protein